MTIQLLKATKERETKNKDILLFLYLIDGKLDALQLQITALAKTLTTIINKENKIMIDLTALQTAVERTTTVEQSAIDLILGIAAQLQEMAQNAVDPAQLQAYADQLTRQADSLSAAVVANTPTPPAAKG